MLALSAVCFGAQARQTESNISVIDSNGRPIENAEVGFFEIDYQRGEMAILKSAVQRTDKHGKVKLDAQFKDKYTIFAAAKKQGYFLGWRWLLHEDDKSQNIIILGKPHTIGGIIVDENNKPIEGAIVHAIITSYQCSGERLQNPINFENDWLTIRTDAKGRFIFSNVPPDGGADFAIEASGYATTYTFYEQDQHPGFQFKAGKDNIKIIVGPAAVIKGRVVDANGMGIKATILSLKSFKRYDSYFAKKQTISDKDGHFAFTGLMAGKYVVVNSDKDTVLQEWLVKGIEAQATVEPNPTLLSVQTYKGELLGIKVVDSETKKPLERAEISLYQEEGPEPYVQKYHARQFTDANGIAYVRKPKSVCKGYAWHDGYKHEDFETDGDNKRQITIELNTYPIARGKVIDESGKAVAGVEVSIKPLGREVSLTDKEGRFNISFEPRSEFSYVYALEREKGLGGLAKVVEGNEINVKVKPSSRQSIKVVDEEGQGITAARVQLHFSLSNWLCDAGIEAITDSNGNCDLGYVAEPENDVSYRIGVYAAGYSPVSYKRIGDWSEDIVLKEADLAVSGKVVDANGRGIAGLDLFCNSSNQARLEDITDENGYFVMNGFSKGEVKLQAGLGGVKGIEKPGYIKCQAGDVNVVIVIGQETAHVVTTSLAGKHLPDINSIGIKVDSNGVKDKMVLLCFVDLNQRPSRHCFNELAQKYNELIQKGVYFAAVQVGNADMDLKHEFQLGQIANDEKTKSAWGVKALPWLILTDKKHNIIAEGFGLDELDNKIAAIK